VFADSSLLAAHSTPTDLGNPAAGSRNRFRAARPSTWQAAPDMILPERGRETVTDVVESLILDLLEWVASRERSYEDVMDAWRTSCPRLPVWEDANDRGLIETVRLNGHSLVRVTPSGVSMLAQRRPAKSRA
jgi:hypothetical protein